MIEFSRADSGQRVLPNKGMPKSRPGSPPSTRSAPDRVGLKAQLVLDEENLCGFARRLTTNQQGLAAVA
jgi:hypothetical protein